MRQQKSNLSSGHIKSANATRVGCQPSPSHRYRQRSLATSVKSVSGVVALASSRNYVVSARLLRPGTSLSITHSNLILTSKRSPADNSAVYRVAVLLSTCNCLERDRHQNIQEFYSNYNFSFSTRTYMYIHGGRQLDSLASLIFGRFPPFPSPSLF